MDLLKIKETFNIAWQIKEKKETFEEFKIRILNDFKHVDSYVSWKGQETFCKIYAIENKYQLSQYGGYYFTNIIDRLKAEDNELEFYHLLTVILNLPFDPKFSQDQYGQLDYRNAVAETIKFSQVPICLKILEHEAYIFPSGEKLLDDELVWSALSFLKGKGNEHFIQVLTHLANKNFISCSESMRRTLEEFFRSKFNNDANWETNNNKILTILKNNQIEPEVIALVRTNLKLLETFFNENSKHHDGIFSTDECYLIIYLSCLLMFYINKKSEIKT